MAYRYGPSMQWLRCRPLASEVVVVRSGGLRGQGNIDLLTRDSDTLNEQVIRLSRFEAENLAEALRRVLASDGMASWSPAVIGDERTRSGEPCP